MSAGAARSARWPKRWSAHRPTTATRGAAIGSVSGQQLPVRVQLPTRRADRCLQGDGGTPTWPRQLHRSQPAQRLRAVQRWGTSAITLQCHLRLQVRSRRRRRNHRRRAGIVDAFDLERQPGRPHREPRHAGRTLGPGVAPSSFGTWAGALLVGNFGDGRIQRVRRDDPPSSAGSAAWRRRRSRSTDCGASRRAAARWPAAAACCTSAPGPTTETHGLFGVLAVVPEPTTYNQCGYGALACLLAVLAAWRRGGALSVKGPAERPRTPRRRRAVPSGAVSTVTDLARCVRDSVLKGLNRNSPSVVLLGELVGADFAARSWTPPPQAGNLLYTGTPRACRCWPARRQRAPQRREPRHSTVALWLAVEPQLVRILVGEAASVPLDRRCGRRALSP